MYRKTLMLFMALVLVAGILLTACSTEQTGEKTQDNAAQQAEETDNDKSQGEITELTLFWNRANENPAPDNIIIKEVEKRTNTKLTIIAPSTQEYMQKLNITMASGDLPHIVMFPGGNLTDMKSYAKQGALVALDEMLNQYAPNSVSYVPQDVWPFMKWSDKTYAIPSWKIKNKNTVYVRQDWLNKLKLEIPKTLDEYYEVMKAFAKNDPDGDGKANTYGWGGSGIGAFNSIYGAFGVMPTLWYWDDALQQLLPYDIHPAMKDALSFLNKAYKEGLINPDWMVVKGPEADALIDSGKVGIFNGWWTYGPDREVKLKGVVPDAVIEPIAPPVGPDGKSGNMPSGRLGRMFSITVQAEKEDKVESALKFLDFFHTPEGMLLGRYGVEGVHWKWKSGQPTPDTPAELDKRVDDIEFLDQYTKDREWIEVMNFFEPQLDITSFPGWSDRHVAAQLFARKQPIIENDGDAITCDARIQYGASLDTLRDETYAKIVTGDILLSAFDDFVKQWRSSHGDEVIKQMTEQYKITYNK